VRRPARIVLEVPKGQKPDQVLRYLKYLPDERAEECEQGEQPDTAKLVRGLSESAKVEGVS